MDLPDDLALPLHSGQPYWYWLGGRPALDLVNTLRERWWRRVETLVTPTDLSQWLVAAGVVATAPRATRADLERARTLREAIDAAVEAAVAGRPLPSRTAAALGDALAAAPPCEHVGFDADGAIELTTGRAGSPAAQALAAVALDAAAMLGPDGLGRIRICASQTCSARFFDRSPAGRRRWCSMQECGNVEKARRHRRRARDERQELAT
jgi:predicted RNA-binding Zn ribbon-like protein